MEDPTRPPTPPTEPIGPAALPWEDPGIGNINGLFHTVSLFLTRPDEAFSRVSRTGLGRPFFYAVLMAWIELIFMFGYWAIFQMPLFGFAIPSLDEKLAEAMVGTGMMVVFAVGILILMPFIVAVGIAIHTCILHLMLLIIGEGRGGFDSTIRAVCYSHTADLANVIPLCGGLISLVWFVALQIIGISRCHRCSYAKATLAVVLPVLLCCSCMTLAASVVGLVALAD